MKVALALLVLASPFGPSLAEAPPPVLTPEARSLVVPRGERILVDGRVDPAEWSKAGSLSIPAQPVPFVLRYQRDEKYLYLALEIPPPPSPFGLDLYVDRGGAGPLLNLHASAKLGEREGAIGRWPDWVWWNNRGWIANVGRIDTFEPRRFVPDGAKELQIELDRLGSGKTSLSFDVYLGAEATALPAEGKERHGRRWLELTW